MPKLNTENPEVKKYLLQVAPIGLRKLALMDGGLM
jgi:hypothetical protein